MVLSARILNNVASANSFDWADQAEFTQGDTVDIYFQLIDTTVDKAVKGFVPGGRRYIPAAGATLSVKLDNIDDAVALTRSATQPFSGDLSIWKLTILATDAIVGTCALALTLTEGAKVTRGRAEAAVLIHSQSTL
jgi:hypothetical protein